MKFDEKVYKVLKQVPKGRVTTYGDIARRIGINSAQAVGQALKRNPDAPRVPCHRVVKSTGEVGGYAGNRNGPKVLKKISLLRQEGVTVENGKIKEFEKIKWA